MPLELGTLGPLLQGTHVKHTGAFSNVASQKICGIIHPSTRAYRLDLKASFLSHEALMTIGNVRKGKAASAYWRLFLVIVTSGTSYCWQVALPQSLLPLQMGGVNIADAGNRSKKPLLGLAIANQEWASIVQVTP